MKTLSPALASHLTQELATLAWLLKLTRRDSMVLAFTTFDRDLTISGTTYQSADSLSLSSLETQAGLAPDNLDVLGMLSSTAITESDIMAGRYDDATVEIACCNWADLSQGLLKLKRGTIGTISSDGNGYRFEIKGLADALETTIGDIYTKACRYAFGDASCTVNTASATYRKTGTLTSITNSITFTDSTRGEAAGFFTHGKITFTSGANSGLTFAIKSFASGQFVLWQTPPFTCAMGDAYAATAGCDKQFTTCQTKFSNTLNFGGFPHIPGSDVLLRTPPLKN